MGALSVSIASAPTTSWAGGCLDIHAARHAAASDRSRFGPRHVSRRAAAPAEDPVKRLVDILLTGGLLILLWPFMAVLAAMVRLDGGAALYGHRRVGARGRAFTCWKFRTMVPNAAELLAEVLAKDAQARAEWERDFKLKCDPRVTRAGKFLRSTSLDELPQLFNVLKGEMSLVGPRPIVRDEVRRYGAAFHDYSRCRPGITGIWQVSGRNDTDYATRVRLDQRYARNHSFALDCQILALTVREVMKRRGAY